MQPSALLSLPLFSKIDHSRSTADSLIPVFLNSHGANVTKSIVCNRQPRKTMRELVVFVICALLMRRVRSEDDVSYEVEERKPCTYFYNDRYAKPEGGLVNCSWYSNQACCKRTEVTSVFSNIEPLHSATRSCRNQLNYLMCFFCSPDQHLWFTDQKLKVCAKFCKSLYEDCRIAGVGNQIIGKEYANGTAFCEAQNFEVVEGASCFEYDPDVFGASITVTANIFHMFVGLLTNMLFK